MIEYDTKRIVVGVLFVITMFVFASIMPLLYGANGDRELKVTSTFFSKNPDNTKSFNGTVYTLTGTDEDITKKYFELGEQFDKQAGTTPNQNVTFFFKNSTNVTVPYSGYKNFASEQLIREALSSDDRPVIQYVICWVDDPDYQWHWVARDCGVPAPVEKP